MNKKIAIISAAFALAMPITPIFAQVTPPTPPTPSATQNSPAGRGQGQMRPELREQRMTNQAERVEMKQNIQAGKEQLAEKRLEFQNKKEQMAQDKCKNIEEKIASRVNRYEANGQMFTKVYGNMQARLTRLVEKLSTTSADLTKLKADIATLNEKIEKLKTDHETFMSTLKESQTFVCGKSEGEFKGKIDQARKVPELIKQDRQDIKTFFETTIKTDLQTIRQALGATKQATEKLDESKQVNTPAVEPSQE